MVLQLSTPAMKTTLLLDGRDGHVRMTDSGVTTIQSVSVSKIGVHITPALALKCSALWGPRNDTHIFLLFILRCC
jgi:hypothetical protein